MNLQLISPTFEGIVSYIVGLTHAHLLQFLIMLIVTILLCADVSASYQIQVPVRLIHNLEYRKTAIQA
jgi:choline-glycine betaine transporter